MHIRNQNRVFIILTDQNITYAYDGAFRKQPDNILASPFTVCFVVCLNCDGIEISIFLRCPVIYLFTIIWKQGTIINRSLISVLILFNC